MCNNLIFFVEKTVKVTNFFSSLDSNNRFSNKKKFTVGCHFYKSPVKVVIDKNLTRKLKISFLEAVTGFLINFSPNVFTVLERPIIQLSFEQIKNQVLLDGLGCRETFLGKNVIFHDFDPFQPPGKGVKSSKIFKNVKNALTGSQLDDLTC